MRLRLGLIPRLGALGVLAAALSPANAQRTFATFDADQYNTNGFRFADFDDDFFGTFDASQGVISLDVQNDFDSVNGLFGGVGSDVFAEFDSAPTQLEVRLRIDPLNLANDLRVILVDSDGEGVGEEYQFLVNLIGEPVDEFITLTQDLLSPGPVFRQAAFGQADGDMVQNFGLTQIQIQSAFGASDRLKVDVESIKLIDPDLPEDPLLIELTPATFATQPGTFDFGTYQDAGVVVQTADAFVIDTAQSPNPAEPGGLGFAGLSIDFNAFEHAIEVEARLLPGNEATSFNLLMGDNDGDDSAPNMGSDDVIFTVATDEFNESEFTTVTIPLGTGSEDMNVTTFGFTNTGDGIQNFGLSQLQIQTDAENTNGGLAIEIARFSVVKLLAIDGDFNADGVVDAADYTIFRDNLGESEDVLRGAGDGSGTVDLGDYALWEANFGAVKEATPAAVPEPSALGLAALVALTRFAARRGR